MIQAKYQAAVRHGVKVVTPDWLIDSIETGVLAEEEEYYPTGRGRGDHTHQSPQEVTQCNGDVSRGQKVTTESLEQTAASQTGTTDNQTIPEADGDVGEREMEGDRDVGEMEVESGVLEAAPVITGEDGEDKKTGNGVVRCSGGEGEREERLLTGLVFHLTGYLECMDPDTLSKWKEVTFLLSPLLQGVGMGNLQIENQSS